MEELLLINVGFNILFEYTRHISNLETIHHLPDVTGVSNTRYYKQKNNATTLIHRYNKHARAAFYKKNSVND